jgi:hypothetical protein
MSGDAENTFGDDFDATRHDEVVRLSSPSRPLPPDLVPSEV